MSRFERLEMRKRISDLMYDVLATVIATAAVAIVSLCLYWLVPKIWRVGEGQFSAWSFLIAQFWLLMALRGVHVCLGKIVDALRSDEKPKTGL